MIFTESPLLDAWVIDVEPHKDERGIFARTYCSNEYKALGVDGNFVQQNISWNPCVGTLRGLHYQLAPYEEEKLVRVTRGAIYDVVVDLRKDSETYGKWFGAELSAVNHRQLYIPKGFAHGFQTLESGTEVFYQMTEFFKPSAARGIRWDDPFLNIKWPVNIDVNNRSLLSEADINHPYWGA